MLTDSQKTNINRLDAQTCIEVMHECAERLGLVSVEDYMNIVGTKRRTIYDQMNNGKIIKFNIGKHKFPCINS